MPVVLVTGVSGGIGAAIADLFADRGWRVFGTMRQPTPRSRMEILQLDVQDEASVRAGVERALAAAGRIDVLVNNAGVSVVGAAEETTDADAFGVLDTNLIGAHRMIRAVLPGMRQRGSGRIIANASVAGFLPMPYQAAYSASKHALEGYIESLDHEVREFGVRAILIEPSFIHTDLRRHSPVAGGAVSAYDERRRHALELLARDLEKGDAPMAVAETVLRAATAEKPRARCLVGRGAGRLLLIRKFLPEPLFSAGFRRRFDLP